MATDKRDDIDDETEEETEDEEAEDADEEPEETEEEEEEEAEEEPEPDPKVLAGHKAYVERTGHPQPPPPPPTRRTRRVRSDRGVLKGPRDPKRQLSSEADAMWGELLSHDHPMSLAKRGVENGAYDIEIQVVRLDTGSQQWNLGSFAGGAVLGNDQKSPGKALYDYIVDRFHLPGAHGQPAAYRVSFVWRKFQQKVGTGRLELPPKHVILDMRAADEERERDERRGEVRPFGGTYYPGPGMGAGPQRPPYGYRDPGPPQGYPPPAYGHGGDETAALRAALTQATDFQRQLLDEVIRAGREGRAPVIPQQPGMPQAPAPAQPEVGLDERIAKSVVVTLSALGIIKPPGAPPPPGAPGVGAGPAPAAAAPVVPPSVAKAASMVEKIQETAFALVETVMSTSLKNAGMAVANGMKTMGTPGAEEVVEAVAEPVEMATGPTLPWTAQAVTDQKLWGKQAYWTADPTTGEWSLRGFLMNNEGVRDKLGEWGSDLVESFTTFLKSKAGGVPGVADLEGARQAPPPEATNGQVATGFPKES